MSRSAHYSDADLKLAAEIERWLAGGRGRSKAALARAAGLSAGTASQCLSGAYPSSPAAHLEALASAMRRIDERRAEPAGIPWTETSVSKQVESVVRRCHLDRDFGVYAGRVGIGKTAALRRYAELHPGASTLLDAYPGATAPVVMRLLAAALGVPGRRRTVADLTAEAVEALQGSDRVILVDEAETLSPQSLLHLRRVSDAGGVGVCLVGTPALMGLVRDPDGRFGQLTSRVGFWPPIRRAIDERDAAALAASYLGRAPDKATAAALWRGCGGSARALLHLMRHCARHCRRDGAELDAELVARVDRSAMGGRRLAA